MYSAQENDILSLRTALKTQIMKCKSWGCGLVVEHLCSVHKALGSTPPPPHTHSYSRHSWSTAQTRILALISNQRNANQSHTSYQSDNNQGLWECEELAPHLHHWWDCNDNTALEKFGSSSKILKVTIPPGSNSTMYISKTCSHKTCTQMFLIKHCSRKAKSKISVNVHLMDYQNVVYHQHNGILFSHKMKWGIIAHTQYEWALKIFMPWEIWHRKTNIAYTYEVLRIGRFTGVESMTGARAREGQEVTLWAELLLGVMKVCGFRA